MQLLKGHLQTFDWGHFVHTDTRFAEGGSGQERESHWEMIWQANSCLPAPYFFTISSSRRKASCFFFISFVACLYPVGAGLVMITIVNTNYLFKSPPPGQVGVFTSKVI